MRFSTLALFPIQGINNFEYLRIFISCSCRASKYGEKTLDLET